MNNDLWLPEEDFKGLPDNFLDNLVDPTNDVSVEDIETGDDEGDWDAKFQKLVPPPLDELMSLSYEFTCNGQRVQVQKHVPILLVILSQMYMDLNGFQFGNWDVKQSSSSEVFSTVDNSPPNVKVSKLLQSLSPVSVLKNTNGSGSPQNPNGDQKLAFLVKGIRSKRKRPTLLRVTFLKSFLLEMSQQFAPDESESSEISALKKRKKNKSRRLKCTHCETTTTPQWREGPNGRKTLCNACGIRFRSGRLVLEYRPAASPTFIPTVHSNLHKKIIYMRMKDNDQFDTRKIRAETSGPETRSRLRNFGRPMSYGQ
ncbi:unnamed protein product [Arabidopsis thaliana]|uniref:(thale cress) hypothetical protein n=1 Tax=Arabidopsis thaliana TaxID=3702 RepID=A0A7G2EBR8_ARATH|nr:unnamed protein product [Arabidopsis thaliana]